MRTALRLAAALALLVLVACAHKPVQEAKAPLSLVTWGAVGPVEDGRGLADLETACRQSLAYFRKIPAEAPVRFGSDAIPASAMAAALEKLLALLQSPSLSPAEKTRRMEAMFRPYKSSGSDGEGRVLVTGYYEPVLEGSESRGGAYQYPLYKRPPDLVGADLSKFPLAKSQSTIYGRVQDGQLVPYYTREEIDGKGALAGKGLELVWLRDPVDLFLLQVQGSGRVNLPDGRTVRVQYDAPNGHPYASLGRAMVEKGLLPKDGVSIPAIRAYLEARPDQRWQLLGLNPSYTFFRLETGGPYGNIGVAITPLRSIATDSKVFPKGVPCLLRTVQPVAAPDGKILRWEPVTLFVFNQDTGGAITGPGRVDLFWGSGPEAERAAGSLQHPGELYLLAPAK
jgi:membrane-bound lytic murein transglycosylase A